MSEPGSWAAPRLGPVVPAAQPQRLVPDEGQAVHERPDFGALVAAWQRYEPSVTADEVEALQRFAGEGKLAGMVKAYRLGKAEGSYSARKADG